MLSLLFVGAALLITLVVDSLNAAPLGYEDERGFHFGTPADAEAN
jgi:hypothetical protein